MKLLKKKYGKKNSRALYNCAIRNEVSGGNKVLDLLELIYKIRKRKVGDERALLDKIHSELEGTRSEFVAEVKRKYENAEIASINEDYLPRFYMAIDRPHGGDGYYVFCRKPARLLKLGSDGILRAVQAFETLEGTEDQQKRTLKETSDSLVNWLDEYFGNL